MALTKKQKKFVVEYYGKKEIEEIARELNVSREEIKKYISAKRLTIEEPVQTTVSSGQFKEYYYYIVILVAVAFIAGIMCFDSHLYISGDNAIYMNLGKGIAEGKGMGNNTQYPFFFPLLLAFVQLLSGNSLLAQKVLIFLFYLGTVPFLFLIFKHYLDKKWSFIITFLAVLSSFLIEFSHYVMTEIPYMFFAFLAVWLVIKSERQDNIRQNYYLFGMILAVMAAYHIRTSGISLVAAISVYFLINKKYKKLLFSVSSFILLMLPWLIRNSIVNSRKGDTRGYITQLLSINPYNPDAGYLNFQTFIERLKANINIYFFREIPSMIVPYRFRNTLVHPSPEYLPLVLSVILSLVFLTGLILFFKRKKDVLSIYTVFFLGICLLWPQVWSGSRFIVPIIPLLVFIFAYCFYFLCERFGRKELQYAAAGIAFLLLIFSFKNIYTHSKISLPPRYANFYKACEWIKENTPEESVVSCRKSDLSGVVTQRESVGFPWAEPDTVFNYMVERNVDYVIIEQLGYRHTFEYLVPAVQKYNERFRQVFRLQNPDTVVLELIR